MTIHDEILNEVKSLENRLRCYHEGNHGRSTVKMSVELKTIERLKEKLKQSRESGQVDAVVMRFEDLALGARFKYKGQDIVWTKLEGSGEGLVAEYDPKYITDPNWYGQKICCAADTIKEMEPVDEEDLPFK